MSSVDVVAKALWDSSPTGHKLLEKVGFATDWESQPESIKRDYRRQAKAAIEALARCKGGSGDG